MLVYMITNTINNKQYVGQTLKTLSERWRRHTWNCTTKKPRMAISLAIKKYGKENFKIEEICKCSSLEELNQKEEFYIKQLNTLFPNGYNIRPTAVARGIFTTEGRERSRRANQNKIVSKETREKLSKAAKGRKLTPEWCANMSRAWKGRRASDIVYKRSSEYNSKKYKLKYNDGREVEITNLKQFCRENNFKYSRLSDMARAKRSWSRYHDFVIEEIGISEWQKNSGFIVKYNKDSVLSKQRERRKIKKQKVREEIV